MRVRRVIEGPVAQGVEREPGQSVDRRRVDAALRREDPEALRREVRPLLDGPRDELIHVLLHGVERKLLGQLADVHGHGGRHADRRGERAAHDLDLSFDHLQRQLRLRRGRPGLQDVGDRRDTRLVAFVGRGQVAPGFFEVRLPRDDLGLGVEVLVVALARFQHDVLDRGVVAASRRRRGTAWPPGPPPRARRS